MTKTTPYFNINKQRIVNSVLDITSEEFELWPNDKQKLALEIASELYLLRCNPFIHPEIIKNRVYSQLENNASELASFYYQFLNKKIDSFLEYIDELSDFQNQVKTKLSQVLDEDKVVDSPNTLVQFSTDATGLMMEIPLLVVFPETTKQIQSIVKLAAEMDFSIVPRGGGSGLTGGAIPALSNAVILSLSKLKKIYDIDAENMVMHAQSGVITKQAIEMANEYGLLFTVDPASKAASSLGGNISENAGGPYAFEYGTTLDNLLSYKMVLPQGDIVEVKRKNHPRHKIYPDDEVNFEILDENDNLLDTISLYGYEIRSPNLGKDVTNKFLGGLPGIQKEGVDGIITEANFVLHPMLNHSRTLCLEFFGSTMHNAALVIEDLVNLRDKIRQGSNAVTMTSLEEFGTKYVKAINYVKKSQRYEGEPISVLLLQLDSNNKRLLENVVWTVVDITENYDNVDVLVSRDQDEANEFWEDRHKLSAISKKTSGFKLNEDVVIPLNKIPEFSDYIEYLNRYYLAHAYNNALERTKLIQGVPEDDEFIIQEQEVCNRILTNSPSEFDPSEQELNLQAYYFFKDLSSRYSPHREQFEQIWSDLDTYRLQIANHMHAGDGNCHINIPVHSDSNEMMELAEDAVDNVFRKVQEIKGEVSGEHGIGITKIRYLSDDKINALKKYKSIQDPDHIINPEKLLQQEPIKEPYNIAWINIIQDLKKTELPQKETLIQQLEHIRICTRCGKCKQVCPMYYPEEGFLNHPRNKNISLGIMIAALTYTYQVANITDQYILGKLQEITEYCTACGKCMQICPVKINSADVTINFRNYLEEAGAGGHPIKSRMLNFLSKEPSRIPKFAKAAAWGQSLQNKTVRFIPAFWRRRLQNPMFKGPGPNLETQSLNDVLNLQEGNVFLPENHQENTETVIYFPGCGSSVFFPNIGLSALNILLNNGYAVILPEEHKCCGYPLLSSGCYETFQSNQKRNEFFFKQAFKMAEENGLNVVSILTSCGTCRAAIENYELYDYLPESVQFNDVFQFISPLADTIELSSENIPDELLYHSSCHSAWFDVGQNEADQIYTENLSKYLDCAVEISPYCCGESGLGGITSPHVYNKLRIRKRKNLKSYIKDNNYKGPILVSCPSCKMGLTRIVKGQKIKNNILHSLEYLNEKIYNKDYIKKLTNNYQRLKFSE